MAAVCPAVDLPVGRLLDAVSIQRPADIVKRVANQPFLSRYTAFTVCHDLRAVKYRWMSVGPYGRGLQASALKEFGKKQDNIESIQKAFNHRARMNGLSSKGEWSEDLEKVSEA